MITYRATKREDSASDDLVQPLDDTNEFLRRDARQSAPDAFGRESPHHQAGALASSSDLSFT